MGFINKLSWPATILIGCLILGGFYYATEANKISSQDREKREAKQAQEDSAFKKRLCVAEAETAAIEQYEKVCSYDCKENYYYTANYDSYYKLCQQRMGLD